MRISISTNGKHVSEHFGRSTEFIIADIIGGELVKIKTIPNPDHSPGAVPKFMHENCVNRIICGGIGAKATLLFNKYNIQVIAGVSGNVDDVIKSFTNGTLVASGKNMCTPGNGRDYGIDKDVCDHINTE